MCDEFDFWRWIWNSIILIVFVCQFQEQLQRKLDYKVAQEYDDEVLESFHLVDACCWLSLISSPMTTGKDETSSSTFCQILINFYSWFQAISIDSHLSVTYISCRMVHDELWVVIFLPCLPRVQCNVSGKFESWSGKRAACLSLCKFWEVQKLRPGTNSDLKVPEFVVL